MSNGLPEDPLDVKYQDAAKRLQWRRQRESETTKEIAERRTEFFYKLALLNAGALTFSATFLGNIGNRHATGTIFLHIGWGLLLLALGACLIRNLSHQHYQLAETTARMAEAEITLIDVDTEVFSTRPVVYKDSPQPFDQERELAINRSNRERWQRSLTDQRQIVERHWRLLVAMEWIAAVSMFFGFLLQVVFAILNS